MLDSLQNQDFLFHILHRVKTIRKCSLIHEVGQMFRGRIHPPPKQPLYVCSIENLSTVIWILVMSTVVRLEYLFTVWWIRVCPDPIIRVSPDPIILPNPDLNHWFVNREMIKIGSRRLFLIVCFRSLLECLQVFL